MKTDQQNARPSSACADSGHCQPVLGMVLKGFPRISETFISNEILLLEKNGFRIHIFSMRQPRESFAHESVHDIRAGVDYLSESILKGFFGFFHHNGALALKKPRFYWKALKLAFRRFFRTRKSATFKHLLQAGYIVHKLLPGSGVVHLHAHFAHSPSSVAMFTALLSGLEFSFTAHAKDIYTSHSLQLKEKIAAARFVVTCTRYNQRYLKEIAGHIRTPVFCVYHGIDVGLFNGPPSSGRPEAPYRLMTVARIVPKKGLPVVYHALALLAEKGVDFRHTLIGDGEDRDAVLSLIARLGLSDVCRWQGTQTHDRVLDHFHQSDLFLLGCRLAPNGDRDGIPNVFMESMAMEVPVVGTAISAIPELIAHEETGLLVPPDDPAAMADAMMRLLTDIPLRSRIIAAAKARICSEFDNRALIRTLADIYRRQQPRLAAVPERAACPADHGCRHRPDTMGLSA
jgi:glycosyltransferase involved in cell wall biosynthesis